MGYFRKSSIAARILILSGLFAATPVMASTFDGAWNVRIASTNTACRGETTIGIGINNGKVESANALMTASGRVADAGDISVTVSDGMKRAVGSGRLTGTSGSGTWRGTLCSGTWTAQRN